MSPRARGAARFAAELVAYGLLAGAMFVAVVLVVQQLVSDEKIQYLIVGYYAAVHHDLFRRLWERLGIADEKVGLLIHAGATISPGQTTGRQTRPAARVPVGSSTRSTRLHG